MVNYLHKVISMKTRPENHIHGDRRSYFRYLPPSEDVRRWGAYVVNAGYTLISPGAPYPPHRHPHDHHFTWQDGRILSSPAMVYLTRGQGEFETLASGRVPVTAGDVFVILPGVWHRYRPDPATGWDEYWVECDGDHLRCLLSLRPVRPEHPVFHVGHDEHLLGLYMEIADLLRREPPDYPFLLGATVELLFARLFSAMKRHTHEGRPTADIIREACDLLTREAGRRQELKHLAAQLNLSYSTFRRMFRAHTGFSPRQYALEISLRRASELLAHTRLPITRVADELGFDSIFYFSRFFKNKTGFSPNEYRKRRQAGGIPKSEGL
jgi:AraC-like DNA-binding protein/quercetin dioxygenase-like cupin family protein